LGDDNVTIRAGLNDQRLSGCLRTHIGSHGHTQVYTYFFFDKHGQLAKATTEWYAEDFLDRRHLDTTTDWILHGLF
jgi:hypothetical protein